jgi:hypothetical protein
MVYAHDADLPAEPRNVYDEVQVRSRSQASYSALLSAMNQTLLTIQ